MDVNIRKASTADFPAIIALIKEFSIFQKTPEKVTTTVEQMNNDENIFQCFVVETNNQEIVGFASFFFAYYSWTGKALYLDDLYVQEQYRKQKIGVQLLNRLIDFGKNENCKRMRWLVSKWNTNAIGFYKKLGATIDETDIHCDLDLGKI